MKRKLSVVMAIVLVIAFVITGCGSKPAGSGSANQPDDGVPKIIGDFVKPQLAPGEFALNVNGTWIDSSVAAPINLDGPPGSDGIVPLELCANALGADYKVDGDNITVTYDGGYGEVAATVTVGSDKVTVNGTEVAEPLTHPVEDREGTVYVPLNFWELAFSSIGEKTELHGFHWFISLRTNATYAVPCEGEEYDFVAGETTYKTDDGEDRTMLYRVVQVNPDAEGDGALVMFLHGSNIRGNDNAIPLVLNPPTAIASYAKNSGMKMTLIVPQSQVPLDDDAWKDSPEQKALMELFEKFKNDSAYSVDPNQVYLIGCSAGGAGTWQMVESYPGYFAAAMPVASAPDSEPGATPLDVNALIQTPLYVVAGEKDTELEYTKPSAVTAMVDGLQAAGATIQYDIMPGLNHTAVCNDATSPARLEWLFGSHTKNFELEPENPDDKLSVNVNGTWVKFDEKAKPYQPENASPVDLMVPLEPVAEAFGDVLTEKDGVYSLVNGCIQLQFSVGSNKMTVNDMRDNIPADQEGGSFVVDLPQPITEKDGVVYAPWMLWSIGFASTGAKMVPYKYFYLYTRDYEPYIFNIDGVDYAFDAKEYRYTNDEGKAAAMRYRETNINQDQDGDGTLIIYLHGSSVRGNDNITQTNMAAVHNIAKYLTDSKIKATLIAPQADKPMGNSIPCWTGNADMAALKAIIDQQVAEGKVSKDNILIMGGSMGGQGTWKMVEAYPDLFTAAMPVAFAPGEFSDLSTPIDYSKLVSTPMLIVAGEKDEEGDCTNAKAVEAAYNQLKAAGGIAEFEIMPGLNHELVCEDAFNKDHLDWLFANARYKK